MRDTRSLRVFNENYPLSRSFSLRVVGVLYPHTPLRGYYTLALPCYLFIAHSNARFVKELRRKICLWGCYTPTPPSYYFIPFSCIRFVKEQRRKNLQGKLAKFFAPLTTTENYIINTRAERSPAPRLNYPHPPPKLRRTILSADTRRGTAFKQLGTGQKCQIFKQFCPVPNCLIFQSPTAIFNPFTSLTAIFR